MIVLFLNHKIQSCGVYQYGLRVFNILKKSYTVATDSKLTIHTDFD